MKKRADTRGTGVMDRGVAYRVNRGGGVWRAGLFTLLGAVCLMIGGCSLLPETPAPASGSSAPGEVGGEADRLAVEDLSEVFAQALPPVDTTVQVSRRIEDPVVDRIARALAARGFGVQRVSADQGANFLGYSRSTEPLDVGTTLLRWEMSIGPVEVRRDYRLSPDGVLVTASPVRLSGARIASTPDHPELEGLEVGDASHVRVDYAAPEGLESSGPILTLVTPEVVDRVARDAARAPSGRSAGSTPSVQALNADRVETGNLFYDGLSNFGPTLDGRNRVDRRVVVFANDSLNLGPGNRRLIEQFVSDEVERGDLISLVGCSNGPTRLEIGNEGLALGRAERVSAELTALGIAPERIFDEGCWAPVSAGDRFPGRGVVVELWRTPS